MYTRGVFGGDVQASGRCRTKWAEDSSGTTRRQEHDILSVKTGLGNTFLLLRRGNVREGKHKNVLFLNEPLFCFIEPGAEGAQRKELAFLNERVNGLTGDRLRLTFVGFATQTASLHSAVPNHPNWLYHRGENNRKSERNREGVRRRHQGREREQF